MSSERSSIKQENRRTGMPEGLLKLLLAGLGAFLFSRFFRPATGDQAGAKTEGERKFNRLVFQGWLIVCGISIAFVLYGFFAFFVIGDKGPPDWDYGSLPDVPGESIYSSQPSMGPVPPPEPQHVDGRPAKAPATMGPGQAPLSPGKETERGTVKR